MPPAGNDGWKQTCKKKSRKQTFTLHPKHIFQAFPQHDTLPSTHICKIVSNVNIDVWIIKYQIIHLTILTHREKQFQEMSVS